MGPSEKAFQQVRNILGKLDRNIDQLRTQRVQPATAPSSAPAPATPGRPAPGLHSTVGTGAGPSSPGSGAGSASTNGASSNGAGAANAPARAPSAYGRATPIPPSGG